MKSLVKSLQDYVRCKTMKISKVRVFYCLKGLAGSGLYHKLTKEEKRICARVLRRFEFGKLTIYDCYKQPSDAKLSAYLECEHEAYFSEEFDCVWSSILSHNCKTFSWSCVMIDKRGVCGYADIYIRYATYKRWHLIRVCSVPYECIRQK